MQYVCANPLCSQLRLFPPNTHTHARTNKAAAPCWWNGGMNGHMITVCISRKLKAAEVWAKEVRDMRSLLCQSDLLCLCFIYQQPPHFYYEHLCFFIQNLSQTDKYNKCCIIWVMNRIQELNNKNLQLTIATSSRIPWGVLCAITCGEKGTKLKKSSCEKEQTSGKTTFL